MASWTSFGQPERDERVNEHVQRIRESDASVVGVVDLGNAGLEYVRDQLNYSKALDRELLQLSLEEGVVHGFAPKDVARDQLSEPSADWGWGRPFFDAAWKLLIESVVKDLRGVPDAYLVVVDALREKSDPEPKNHTMPPHVFYGEDVYYLLRSNEVGFGTCYTALDYCLEYPAISVVTSWPRDRSSVTGEEVDAEVISAWARNARRILVGAHDALCYVSWTRRPGVT
jgi:hypothetical protein